MHHVISQSVVDPLYRIGHGGTLVIKRSRNVIEHKGDQVTIPNVLIELAVDDFSIQLA